MFSQQDSLNLLVRSGSAPFYFKFLLSLQVFEKQLSTVALCCCHCCSVTKSWWTLSNSMDCSTTSTSVLHCPMQFSQIHVHCVGTAWCWKTILWGVSQCSLHEFNMLGGRFVSWMLATSLLRVCADHYAFYWRCDGCCEDQSLLRVEQDLLFALWLTVLRWTGSASWLFGRKPRSISGCSARQMVEAL